MNGTKAGEGRLEVYLSGNSIGHCEASVAAANIRGEYGVEILASFDSTKLGITPEEALARANAYAERLSAILGVTAYLYGRPMVNRGQVLDAAFEVVGEYETNGMHDVSGKMGPAIEALAAALNQ